MLSSFFPNKNKVYSSRSLPEPAHPTSFLIMAIICRSWRGCKVALLCVCTGAIALFHVPLFLATSAHPFNWVNRWLDSFCLLQSGVHLPLSLLFLPSPRLWMYVANFTMKRCSLQHCSRSETIPLLQINFLSSSILIFIWDLMWVKYHPVLFLLIMAGSYFRVRFLLGIGSYRLNRARRWLGKRADTKKSTDFPLVGNLADPSFIHFGGCCVDPVENIAKKGIYWNQASKKSVSYRK